jgi:GH35 family endo-1,4-beta-xylanase
MYIRTIIALLLACSIAKAQDPYYLNLQTELETNYELPAKDFVIGGNEQAELESFTRFWLGKNVSSSITTHTIIGQTFSKYMSISLEDYPRVDWYCMLESTVDSVIHANDCFLLTFWARCPSYESSQGFFGAGLRGTSNSNSFSTYFEINNSWRQFFIPWKAGADDSKLTIRYYYGKQLQTLQIAGVGLVNYETDVAFDSLPYTKPAHTYPNQSTSYDDNINWLNNAKSRIKQIRKSDLTIIVRDQNNDPVENASIKVNMLQHNFPFGTAASGYEIFDSWQKYEVRSTLLDIDGKGHHFNNATNGAMKWNAWRPERVDKWVEWCYNHDLKNLYAHTLMWGDEQSMPDFYKNLPKDEKYDSIKAHISKIVQRHKGQYKSWDILNETFMRRTWENELGYNNYINEVTQWFNLAHQADSTAEYHLNDNRFLSEGTHNWTRFAFYKQFIADLKSAGAPLSGLGLQSHFELPLPDPLDMKRKLDSLATFGLNLHITEFDIGGSIDTLVQADFLRDFYTLCFSHPAIKSMKMWGAWDFNHWKGNAPLFDENNHLKLSGTEYTNLLFNKWWTNENGSSNINGVYTTRGFKGDYLISVSKNDQKIEKNILLTQDDTIYIDMSKAVSKIIHYDTIYDPYQDWSVSSSYTNGMKLSGSGGEEFEYDLDRASRKSISSEHVCYEFDNIYSFYLKYYFHSTKKGNVNILIHHPDSGWYDAIIREDSIKETSGGWKRIVLRSFKNLTEGHDSLKITISNGEASWSPHLSLLQITTKKRTTTEIPYVSDYNRSICIYPNPTKGKIFINKVTKFKLRSITGQLLKKGKSNLIHLSEYANGIFLLEVEDSVYKIIKSTQ